MKTGFETISQEKQTLEEENEGEDDLFSESRGKGGKISKGEITKRIKIIKNDPEFADELKVLTEYQKLVEKEAELKKQIKSANIELDKNLGPHGRGFLMKASQIEVLTGLGLLTSIPRFWTRY